MAANSRSAQNLNATAISDAGCTRAAGGSRTGACLDRQEVALL